MSIPRGTTPINYFTVPLDLSEASVVYLTYSQNGNTVVEKEKDEITFTAEDETYEMSVQLTQADTLAFNDKSPVDMQIRARFPGGNAVESVIMRTSVDRILKDGVI